MSVLMNKDKTELIVTCKCGCDAACHITIEKDGRDTYTIVSFMNGNFYTDQYGGLDLLKEKLKKIWAIIRNKDYYYADVVMNEEDFKVFKEYVNSIEVK